MPFTDMNSIQAVFGPGSQEYGCGSARLVGHHDPQLSSRLVVGAHMLQALAAPVRSRSKREINYHMLLGQKAI